MVSDTSGLSGFVVAAKPVGASSTDLVKAARRAVGNGMRVGHCGTLDPLAAGVLPLAVGRATRLSGHVLRAPKTYLAAVLFGVRTTTDDLEGEILGCPRPSPDISSVLRVLPKFVGTVRQRPPATSAVRANGRRAYARVRAGEKVVLPERDVDVYNIRVVAKAWTRIGATGGQVTLGMSKGVSSALVIALEVTCGRGTYIRSLARDIGSMLQCGATLAGLVRTAVGPFRLSDAIQLDVLRRATATDLTRYMHPPDVVVEDLPARVLMPDDREDFLNGRRIMVAPIPSGLCRFYDVGGMFLGVAVSCGGTWGKRYVTPTRP